MEIQVGDGNLGDDRDGFVNIEIPEDNLIYDVGDLIAAILESIYPSIADNYRTNKYFEDRATITNTQGS
ncbi:hypothetical protein ACS0TY_026756 [Phlomoides rotata]